MLMKKALFIDRDGTIIKEPPRTKQVDSLEKLEFMPGAISALRRLRLGLPFEFVMVTNQDGLGTSSFPEKDFWPAQKKMLSVLKGEGVEFDDILIDRSLPRDNAPTRKPGLGLLGKYLSGNYDLTGSYVIGDRATDVELAANLGALAIGLSKIRRKGTVLCTDDWRTVADHLLSRPRQASVRRVTGETAVTVDLSIDGRGRARARTGIGFFDHMLEQLGPHGGFDLSVRTRGDLRVDEHHTVEDTALALGKAFREALGDKRGIARYGFTVPMDESLAEVALDLGGRPGFAWKAVFKREKVGGLPAELFPHFFKSFSDAAGCTLHIRASGANEHHKIEAVFKAFARALGRAARRDKGAGGIPSSKGAL